MYRAMRPPHSHKMEELGKEYWSPEEDIILASYVQQHGACNWRAVSEKTGLRRCGKSCRFRWRNYLRPGIKRGNYSREEEDIIIRGQARLGNRWSVIASFLPQRTDNDIKNYWYTHLKKKVQLRKRDNDEVPSASRELVAIADSNSSSNGGLREPLEGMLQTDIDMAGLDISHGFAISPAASSTTAVDLTVPPGFSSSMPGTQSPPSSEGGCLEGFISPAHALNTNVPYAMFPDGLNIGSSQSQPSPATTTYFPLSGTDNLAPLPEEYWLKDPSVSTTHDHKSTMIIPSLENNQGVSSSLQVPCLKSMESWLLHDEPSVLTGLVDFGATNENEREDLFWQNVLHSFGGHPGI